MGSKNRHAKHILPIILRDRKIGQWYVEPFVGGFNMIDKVDGNRIANDSNYFLIELFKSLQLGWIPPQHVSESEYNDIKNNRDKYPAHLVGYVGFNSFGAKFFGGFCRRKEAGRDDSMEHYRNIEKQREKIMGIEMHNGNYDNFDIPDNSIIYCDPPYASTTGYGSTFDHEAFWEWARAKSNQGHDVFVSEYSAPHYFECVWSNTVNCSVAIGVKYKKGTEKLFVYKQR